MGVRVRVPLRALIFYDLMATHNDLGKKGEIIALNFLKENGYQILETNYRFSRAEIDIIAIYEKVLIFIEVKTRSKNLFGNPEDFINARKLELMMDAAYNYMEKIGHEGEIRFDVISILMPKNGQMHFDHFKDAFVP